MKVRINDLGCMVDMISAIIKIVPSAIFTISSNGVKVNSMVDGARVFFDSDCMVSDSDVEFAFDSLATLLKSLKVVQKVEKLDEIVINYSRGNITYNNVTSFKLKTIKPELVRKYYSVNIKATPSPIYTFKTSSKQINELLKCSGIVATADSKVYFANNNNSIIAEIDDKLDDNSNSLGLPIGTLTFGDVSQVIITTIDNVRRWAVLQSDDINVSYTDRAVFSISTEVERGNSKIKMFAITSVLKR